MTIGPYIFLSLIIFILVGILFARGKNTVSIKISGLNADNIKIKILNFFMKNNFRYIEQGNNIIGIKGSKLLLGQRTFNIKLDNSDAGCNLYGEFYLNSAGIKMKFAKWSWVAGLGRRDGWKLMNAFISELSEKHNG
jgi:hypothetical protein